MSMHNDKKNNRPIVTNPDHARPLNAPAPSNAVVEARLAELLSPATYALTSYYHQLGLRWRILNLPIMVALVLAMIWRQVPGVSTLVRMAGRESILWAPPLKVSQQALSLRLRCLPADLFGQILHAILPILLARAAGRTRPQPLVISRTLQHFDRICIVDATTLEALFRKVGLLRDVAQTTLGGKVLALLDLPSKLPIRLWLDDDPLVNEKSFLEQVQTILPAGTLLLFDLGFYAFPFFDWLTEHGLYFLTRARSVMAFTVQQVIVDTPRVRDRIIALGRYRSNRCTHPVRLVEVWVDGVWHAYLTNVLDPALLPTADVADLYGRRWRIEEAFLLAKRLLGLAYLWTGASNGIRLQVWATWLLYGVLIDLSDAIAQQLNLPLERISVEMVYRSLYYFTMAYQQGQASDPVSYLAAPQQRDLGIIKHIRKSRERAKLDKLSKDPNL